MRSSQWQRSLRKLLGRHRQLLSLREALLCGTTAERRRTAETISDPALAIGVLDLPLVR